MLCIDGSNFASNSSQRRVQGRPFLSSHWPKQGVVPTDHPPGRKAAGQIRMCDVTSLFDHSKFRPSTSIQLTVVLMYLVCATVIVCITRMRIM